MLTELCLEGFKTFRERTVIPLDPVSVIVGANNSGKTNMLSAVGVIGEVARGRDILSVAEQYGGIDSLRSRPGGGQLRIELKGRVQGVAFEYAVAAPGPRFKDGDESFRVEGPPPFALSVGRVDGQFAVPGGGAISGGAAGSGLGFLITAHVDAPHAVRAIYDFLQGLKVFDFSIPALRAPSTIRRNPRLERDGSGLAAVLDHLQGEFPEVRDQIDEEVCSAAPDVKRVVTLPTDVDGQKLLGIAERSGNVFSASALSDGLLLFIAISTVAQMSGGRTLIGLEELEKGIHPRRIRQLLSQLRVMSEKGSQFILSTHSPSLLDEFRDFPESVLLVDRVGDQSRVRRLSSLPDIHESLKHSSLGEIWYSGILGGVPAG